MTHQQVVEKFKEGKARRGSRIFAEGDNLYSFGTHFKLAVRRQSKDGNEWFLLNGDKYSNSTSAHQSITYSVFSGSPRVAFSAIRAAGIDPMECDLIDFIPDASRHIHSDEAGFDTFKNEMPFGAEYKEWKDYEGKITSKSFHRVGSALLRQGQKYYLCSMDEGSYFVSLLPHKVATVKKAFEALKPYEATAAEANGQQVQRQGEWFFIETSKPAAIKQKDFKSKYVLPSEDSSSNLHVASKGVSFNEYHFVKGSIYHRDPITLKSSGDHKTLRLEKGSVFVAVLNKAVKSWSASGRVD